MFWDLAFFYARIGIFPRKNFPQENLPAGFSGEKPNGAGTSQGYANDCGVFATLRGESQADEDATFLSLKGVFSEKVVGYFCRYQGRIPVKGLITNKRSQTAIEYKRKGLCNTRQSLTGQANRVEW